MTLPKVYGKKEHAKHMANVARVQRERAARQATKGLVNKNTKKMLREDVEGPKTGRGR